MPALFAPGARNRGSSKTSTTGFLAIGIVASRSGYRCIVHAFGFSIRIGFARRSGLLGCLCLSELSFLDLALLIPLALFSSILQGLFALLFLCLTTSGRALAQHFWIKICWIFIDCFSCSSYISRHIIFYIDRSSIAGSRFGTIGSRHIDRQVSTISRLHGRSVSASTVCGRS